MVTGGLRAAKPLSPVHLRLVPTGDGGARLSWVRRGRLDADGWLAGDIPLGEESEAYQVEIAASGRPGQALGDCDGAELDLRGPTWPPISRCVRRRST